MLTTRISDFNMLTYSNSNKVMEPSTISKNGASRKSYTRRGNLLTVLVCAMIALFCASCSSSTKITKGSLNPLKGQEKVNVVLDFSGTLDEWELTQRNAGEKRAQLLSERNEQLRIEAYKLLIEKMNNVVQRKRFTVGNYPNAKYSIYVQVKDLKHGTHLGFNSAVTADVSFEKTGAANPMAIVTCYSLGRYSYYIESWASRTAVAFGYLGDNIGKVILKNLK